jgi:hypothetical protein
MNFESSEVARILPIFKKGRLEMKEHDETAKDQNQEPRDPRDGSIDDPPLGLNPNDTARAGSGSGGLATNSDNH